MFGISEPSTVCLFEHFKLNMCETHAFESIIQSWSIRCKVNSCANELHYENMTFSVQRPFWCCNFWFSINQVRLKGNTHKITYKPEKSFSTISPKIFFKKMLDEKKIHLNSNTTPCGYFCQNLQKAPQNKSHGRSTLWTPHLLLSLRPVVQQISPLEAEAIREDGSNLFQHGIFNPGPAGSHGLFWRQTHTFSQDTFFPRKHGGKVATMNVWMFFFYMGKLPSHLAIAPAKLLQQLSMPKHPGWMKRCPKCWLHAILKVGCNLYTHISYIYIYTVI